MNEKQNFVAPIVNYNDKPLLEHGEGLYVFDTNGKKYIDLNSGQFCAVLGHGNKDVAKLIYDTTLNLIHVSSQLMTPDTIDAAKLVHDICPEMNAYVTFLSTGAEANECCLRYAKHLNGNRAGIVSFDVAYHGISHGTEGYSMGRQYVKPRVNAAFVIPAPIDETFCAESIDAFEKILQENHNEIAAALFEPIVSSGGMIYPPKEYWQEIRRLCDKYKIYFIFDECQTGFGRTGTYFYYQQLNCIPDFITCAKSAGLGFPVSLVIFNGNKIDCSKFDMIHFSSHQNDPLSAVLVKFLIESINKNNLLDKIKNTGAYLVAKLKNLAANYPQFILNPRGKGLMCGFNLGISHLPSKDKFTLLKQCDDFCALGLNNGIIMQGCNVGQTIRILPGFIATNDDIDFFIDRLEKTVRDYLSRF